MTYFFAVISAIAFGLMAKQLALLVLERILEYRTTVQLKILTGETRPKVPFRVFVESFEKWQGKVIQVEIFKNYLNFLNQLIQRSQKTELKPEQIVTYQILAALLGIFIFMPLTENTIITFFASALGAFSPILWLRDMAFRREKDNLKELPTALEVISLCVEAGLSLEQGLTKYLQNSKPQSLKSEFTKVLEQTKMGSSRKDSLQSMSSRLNLTDVSLFVTSVVHAERFGTGMAKTLRQLAITMRDKQVQRAEKAIQELPVKMLLPLLLFIMPVTFLIIFGPILLDLFH
jgi:tight adherence protein C